MHAMVVNVGRAAASTASSVCDGVPTVCKKRTATVHWISRKAGCSREQDQMPDTPLPRQPDDIARQGSAGLSPRPREAAEPGP